MPLANTVPALVMDGATIIALPEALDAPDSESGAVSVSVRFPAVATAPDTVPNDPVALNAPPAVPPRLPAATPVTWTLRPAFRVTAPGAVMDWPLSVPNEVRLTAPELASGPARVRLPA